METKQCPTCSRVLPIEQFVNDKRVKVGWQCKACHSVRMATQREKYKQRNRSLGLLREGLKNCSKCKQEKQKTEFSANVSMKDGLNPWCKACDSEKRDSLARKYKEVHSAEYPTYNEDILRMCSKCGTKKKVREFSIDTTRKDGLCAWCRSCANNSGKKFRAGNIAKHLLKSVRTGAKQRGLEFSITEEDLVVPEHCPIFGFKMEPGGKRSTSPSVDRIDNTKGYIPGNVVVVSVKANHVKSDCSMEELKRLVEFYESLQKK